MIIDWLVIIVYLSSLAVIGVRSAKKIKTVSSFFISERDFGKTMMTFFNFGTGTNTDQTVTVVSKTYVLCLLWYKDGIKNPQKSGLQQVKIMVKDRRRSCIATGAAE